MKSEVHIVLNLLVLYSLIIPNLSYPQNDEVIFEHTRIEEGMPLNNVTCILQDRFGFLWLGTKSGLVKYNGYEIKVYQPKIEDSSSISGLYITTICEDQNGTLWVGTNAMGLNRIDYNTNKFTHYKNNKDTTTLTNNSVKVIYEDDEKRLWIGTVNGLNLFNPRTNNFQRYYLHKEADNIENDIDSMESDVGEILAITENQLDGNLLIGSNLLGLWNFDIKQNVFSRYNLLNHNNKLLTSSINSFYRAKDGSIWMGTNYGLAKLVLHTNRLEFYQIILSQEYNPINHFVSLEEDAEGFLWVGTYWEGLAKFDPHTKIFHRYQYDRLNPNSLYGFWIHSLYEDNSGILWIGIETGGLDKWDKKKRKFRLFNNNPLNPKSLSAGWVFGICEDRNGDLWVGTEGGGLNHYDRKGNRFIKYTHDAFNSSSISSDYIWCILEDTIETGVIWIGTWKDGLNKFEPEKGTFTCYQHDPSTLNTLSHNSIHNILIDKQGTLWVATWGGGLNRFDRSTETFTRFQNDKNNSNSLSDDFIFYIYEDREGSFWIATQDSGLARFDRKTESFESFNFLANIKGYSRPNCIYEDLKGNLWVGTNNNGIHLFDRGKGIFTKYYTVEDGMSDNYVTEILEDDAGNLWIGTNRGITKFNPFSESFKTYGVSDGLQGLEFNPRSAFKSPSGVMYFGGERGFNSFHPDSVKDDPFPPQVVIENVSLFNRPGEKITFEKYIAELDEIKLPHDQNDLRFDFVGLHYGEPSKNIYKYILDGFDENWIESGTQRNATYTNLDPGEYIFKCKAANKDGIWNEEGASIKIIILPPWWATTWAYLIYAMIILTIIYFTWKLQLKRIRIKHEFEMSKFEADKMHEVDEMKSRFFENISHEFRTPLTLILGLTKQTIERTKESKTKGDNTIVHKSANRLHGLVNQLLDLSKLEMGSMKLQTFNDNIIPLLKGLVLSFASFAERKKISLKFQSEEEDIEVFIDKDKIERIVINLLSNAFKFTAEGGKVEVKVRRFENKIEIKISDTGIGIPHERLDNIFDRFYQVDSSHTRKQEGTGIGLALTKELVELHKGQILVESEEGKGTTFTVRLPLGKDHLTGEEILEKRLEKEAEIPSIPVEEIPEANDEREKLDIDLITETEKPLLLIIDDNEDVRNYIRGNLESENRILESVNGKDGMDKALEYIPDLIVSDVMMPEMNGFELCKKLKIDERTSHIPIILLTAKASGQDKIDGLETGADDYIMKPFDSKELQVRIKNLIEQRKKLRERFTREAEIPNKKSKYSKIDEQFLKKAMEIIQKHIAEPEFNLENFGKEIGMSRMQLHRKIKALTDHSPHHFIRFIRLKKAAKLLREGSGNVTEIAYDVGYSSLSNFSKAFKEQFGKLPSDYNKI